MRLLRAIAGWFIDPSTLLAFAGVLTVAGLAGGYINVQQRAERELALRQGPPEVVAVETYESALHMGPAREVRIRAVVDLDDPLILTIPGGGETVIALPLFPVDSPSDVALGVVVVPVIDAASLPDPAELMNAVVPRGSLSEIEIGGTSDHAGDFELMVAGALSTKGMQLSGDALTVRPFLRGRELALQVPVNPPRWWLWCLSLASIFVALAGYRGLWAAPRALARARIYEEERAQSKGGRNGPVRTPHFQPLPSQEEVNVADDPLERTPSRVVQLLLGTMRLLGQAGLALGSFVFRPVIDRISDLRSSR